MYSWVYWMVWEVVESICCRTSVRGDRVASCRCIACSYLCWEMKTYCSLSAIPDASQMKHGLECVRYGEVNYSSWVGSAGQANNWNLLTHCIRLIYNCGNILLQKLSVFSRVNKPVGLEGQVIRSILLFNRDEAVQSRKHRLLNCRASPRHKTVP